MPRRSGKSRTPGRRWGTSAVADIHARDIERRGIMSEDKEITRRQFLGAITWAIGGLISLGFGVPAIAFLLGPALRREEAQTWIPLAATKQVELRPPTLSRARTEHQTG